MIDFPEGTILVTKVKNNDFIEESLNAEDIPVNTSGSPYEEVNVTGTNLQTAFSGLCEQVSTMGGGGVQSINGITSGLQSFTVGSSGTDFNITSAGSSHTFNLPSASTSNRGAMTTGDQTLSGNKTFTNDVTVQGHVITANIGETDGSVMTSINGYIREASPSTPLETAGNQILDCTLKSTWRKTGGASTVTLSGMAENQLITMIFESIGSAYILTWSGGSGETFRWPAGATPAPSAIPNTFDVYTFMKIGGAVYSNAILSMK